MKLNSGTRAGLFADARALSPQLGDLFQNPIELTDEMLQDEIRRAYQFKREQVNRIEGYIWKLSGLKNLFNLPMFEVGKTYRTVGGEEVTIAGTANAGTSYETVYSLDPEDGHRIHRYNRRDYGRVTGTRWDQPDPRNLIRVEKPTPS